MHTRIRGLRFVGAVVAAALTLSACGGSSGDQATGLLKQTFGQSHAVNSGNLNLSLIVVPAGSKTANHPITVSFGGPFQSRGKGELPASNFSISVSALGRSGSLGILSTGANGYVALDGTSYQLPPATFQRLESSFSQITASPGAGSNSSALSKLGINPLHWLVNPAVLGNEQVGGAQTTHIRAGVNVAALLGDLNTFLQKASSAGVTAAGKLPGQLSDSTRNRIAQAVRNPRVDVWTGSDDKMVRKLTINLTVPVSGQVSALLGGITSAQVGLSLRYADVNKPQTISAPSTVRPFSEFSTKLRSFLVAQQAASTGSPSGSAATGSSGSAATGSSGLAASGSSGSTPSSGSGPGGGAGAQSYMQCIQAAGQDVTKMQQCAGLLNAK